MRNHPSFPFRRWSQAVRCSGAALVVVLGLLALVLILVVAFLSSVSVELQSAKKYSGGADARALADSAVSLVISQIQDATGTPTLAWASQPGMIRTYDDSGAEVTAYKLYSSGTMRVNGGFHALNAQAAEVPADWADSSALYTDLNAPVAVSGTNRYPILSPAAVARNAPGNPAVDGSSSPVEGCYIETGNPAVAGKSNPVPMPVQWLYVLSSGSLAAIDPATGIIADASEKDPIVGRIAFWTDDETCKVNINTASEGTFWDRPWTTGKAPSSSKAVDGGYERRLAASIPVQNEFQRYPGHPAMTCLSPILPRMDGESELAYKERIYSIIPRLAGGGSRAGTAYVSGTNSMIVPDNERLFASVDEFLFSASNVMNGKRVENLKDGSRPFAVEDLEKTRFFLTAHSRAPEVNLFNKPRVTLWPLQANPGDLSHPEGSPYRNSKDKLIAFCSTIGNKPYYFQRYNVYTPGEANPSSQSPTMDWDLIPRNQELYAYLQALTNWRIPGLGGSLAAKYPNTRDQILTEMFDLIRSMVNTTSTSTTESVQYYYTPFSPSGFITGQGQVVPLRLPNGTKGFGRFATVTEMALVLFNQDPLKISGTLPPGGVITSGTSFVLMENNTENPMVLDKYEVPDLPTDKLHITGTDWTLSTETDEPRNIGAAIILEPFNPTPGPPPWTGNARYVLSGLDALQVGFPNTPVVNLTTAIDSTLNSTSQAGFEANFQRPVRQPKNLGMTDPDNPDPNLYPFVSSFVASGTTMNFPGGRVRIDIYQGAQRPLTPTDLVQTIEMDFPPVANLPLPAYTRKTVASGTTTVDVYHRKHRSFCNFFNRLDHMASAANIGKGRWGIAEDNQHRPLPLIVGTGGSLYLGDTVRSVEARYGGPARGDYRMIAGLANVPSDYFEGHGEKDPALGGPLYSSSAPAARLVHNLQFDPFPGSADTSNSNGFYAGAGGSGDPRGKLVADANYNDPNRGNSARNSTRPVAPRGLMGATMANGLPGDWDNGVGNITDGPYVNPPDQASANKTAAQWSLYYEKGGYVNSNGIVESGASFSPNRQIASAVAFGSLPTGIDPANPGLVKPWQTLLFNPHPAAGAGHPGFGVPVGSSGDVRPPYATAPDHAFLDLFTMPIVEPYAISEPFSTAGKVNMNYQIVPFTYLTRSTGVRAVLKSTNMMAIPTNAANSYKYTANNPPDFRYTLDLDEETGTLAGFTRRFATGEIFRSASEICEISLVPDKEVLGGGDPPGNPTYSDMADWWKDFQLTGDNVREVPYGHIYPRLTTKSNTFTVHVQAQSIAKANGTDPRRFVEGKDQITGEFRGSFLIERFLDPNSDSLVNAAGEPAQETDRDAMVGPYKFRVISTKKFAP